MITKTQYLDALRLVKNYEIQMQDDLNSVFRLNKSLSISLTNVTLDTLIKDADLSIRCLNSLQPLLKVFSETKDKNWEDIKVGDFIDLTKEICLNQRNFGTKSINELADLFYLLDIDF